MRPTRRAAAIAAAAVARPLSPSPVSSSSSSEEEEDEMHSFDELEEMDTGENEQVFSEEDEIDDEDQPAHNSILDNHDGMESLSEQDDEDDEQDIDQDEDDDEEDGDEEKQIHVTRKPARSINNKRKKPAVEQDSDEEVFSDDAEIVRNRPMTKRQRAKVYQEIPEEYLELPMDTGKKKHLTQEEEQLKKSEVARRRKNQSIQRAEKDKADTINRLLKKQASKSKRIIDDTEETAHEKLMKSEDPNRIRYINSSNGSKLCIPSVFTIQHIFGETNSHQLPPKVKKCEVKDCLNNRKYTAKKSGKSVCSLEHYKVVEAK